MSKQLINLTLLVVIEEIDNILAIYPNHPYQQAFSNSELRQDLITYVLSRVPNQYAVENATQSSSKRTESPYCSSTRLLDIEHWIHIGIRDVLHIYNRTNCYMPQAESCATTNSSLVSSRWN